jgi:hypothetical protein
MTGSRCIHCWRDAQWVALHSEHDVVAGLCGFHRKKAPPRTAVLTWAAYDAAQEAEGVEA